jgi:hypothetical protein
MATFKEANQVRLALKMKFSNFAWYKGSIVLPDHDGFCIVINSHKIDNTIRKLVSPTIDGVSIKVEV